MVDDWPACVEVASGVYRVDSPLGDRVVSLYLMVGDDGILLYDTGVDGTIPTALIPALKQLGRGADDVIAVIVSHCDVDHFGGVMDARELLPRARILAGHGDLPIIEDYDLYLSERGRSFLEVYGWDEDPDVLAWCREVTREGPLDGTAEPNQIIDLGGDRQVTILHVPGHSHGHLALDIPWANALVIGDAVLGSSVDSAQGAPLFPPTYRFVGDYRETIARLDDLNRELLLTAHYPTMRGAEVRGFFAMSQQFVENLDRLVSGALGERPEGQTLAELLERLNKDAGAWPTEGTHGALAFPVVGHLELQVAEGRARRVGERDGIALWAAQ